VDRCALFVDVGYVLGDGAMAVHGTRNRESVSWDYAGVLQVLKNVAREHTGLPLLRCYWYETTVESSRSDEHNTLSDLPGVKLRLGRMRPGRREGVESEIHRDLTTLARNRAISDALVVSADEDLAQVIADVQDLGIRVVLVHIGAPGWIASPALRQECDDIAEIGAAHLRPSVELVIGAEPISEEERQVAYPSRAPANGHGRPGVIGQPQAQPAGSHVAPSAIYTGAEIAEYQRAAQPASSQPPAVANASGALVAGQPRPGENGVASLAPGGPGLTAPPPPAPLPPAPRPSAPPPGVAAPPGPATGAAPAGTPYSRDISDYPTLPPQPGVAPQSSVPSGRPMPPPGPLPQGQTLAPAPVPAPAPLPQRTRVGGQHAGTPSPLASSAPTIPGQHAQHASPPGQLAPGQPAPLVSQPEPGQNVPPPGQPAPGQNAPPPGQPAPGQSVPPPGQPAPGQAVPPPGQPVPPPGQAMPAYQAAPAAPPAVSAQPGFRGQVPDVAAARQAAATPRPPTVGAPPGPALGAPPGPALGAPPGAVPTAPPSQPGQPPQPGQAPLPAQSDAGVAAPYVPQPVAVALADAVQAAHSEGFSFGQAVARDAPALWLEAVLARKPRMPSDLEARLLQDSSLPIDSLLHDEVRHALRRGFWDALERVRH
jgi:NYN domain